MKQSEFNDIAGDGMKKSGKPFITNKEVKLVAPIHCDLFKQDRYLLSDCELSTEVHRNDNKFLLMSDGTEYRVIVEDLRLYIWKVKPQESLSLAIESQQNIPFGRSRW